MTQKRLLSSEIGRKSILHKSVKQYVGKCGAERHLSIKGGTEQVRQLCWQATILAPYQTLCMSYYADTYVCEHLHCHLSPTLRGQIYFEIVLEISFEIVFAIVFELVLETYLKLYLKQHLKSFRYFEKATKISLIFHFLSDITQQRQIISGRWDKYLWPSQNFI